MVKRTSILGPWNSPWKSGWQLALFSPVVAVCNDSMVTPRKKTRGARTCVKSKVENPIYNWVAHLTGSLDTN